MRTALPSFTALSCACWMAGLATAQIQINAAQVYTQNFDTLGNSGTNNVLAGVIPNLVAYQAGGSQGTGVTSAYDAGNGNSNTGALYSFGSTNSTERALGSLGSGRPGNLAYGFVFENTSTATLGVRVSYTGEQWRNGGNLTPHELTFTFKISTSAATANDFNATSATAAGFLTQSNLSFTGPVANAAVTALDGNAAGNRMLFADVDLAVSVAPGEFLSLRYFDPNDAGNDHGLGIDDLSVSFAVVPVPEPGSLFALSAGVLGLGTLVGRRSQRPGSRQPPPAGRLQ